MIARRLTLAAAGAVVLGLAPAEGPTVRLDPAEAARRAEALRQATRVQLHDGLAARVFASDTLLADPMAIDVDATGAVYVTGNGRNVSILDIRGHQDWVPTVHTLTTVEDLRQFYRRVLSPEHSATNAWIPDRNNDGSRDWRDFTVDKDRVYRIADESGDGVADVSRVVFEGFNEDPVVDVANGVLLHGGAVYVSAAPDVWELRDADGDGALDAKKSVAHGFNVHPAFFGHGAAGLTLGPDGRLYWSVGDLGTNIAAPDGQRFRYPNQGVILRANFDGSGLEVFASGLRNSQAIAFDDWGNLIGVDNDGDHQGEHERIVYITEGSEAGWRSNWQYGKYTDPDNNRYKVWMDEGLFRTRFDGQAAYITPPVAAARAGPSGLVYNPGTALGPRWRNTFFVSYFPGTPTQARVNAFRLREEGAGFALTSDTTVVQGILTVGMRFGPDGVLYLADWIDGWNPKGRGRIWTIDGTDARDAARAEVPALLRAAFAGHDAARLRGLLRHADQRVRLKAQHELARRGDVATLTAVATASAAATDTAARLARVHGIWGLGQLARVDARHGAALGALLRDGDAEVRAQAAKAIGDARLAGTGDALVPLLADASPRARFFAAEALGRLRHAAAIAPIVAMLAENDDRDVYLRQAGATALARIGQSAPVAALASHPSRGARLAAVVALRRMKDASVAAFLADADEAVATEAARAINDDGGIPAALPALARVLAERRSTSEPLLRRATSASLRLGTADAANRVAAFAARRDAPEALRVDALGALGVWPKPSPMDRVDGYWLGAVQPRDSAAARSALARLVEPLLAEGESEAVQVAAADAAGRLRLASAGPLLLARLRARAPTPVRLAALQALRQIGGPSAEPAVRLALADADSTLRSAALGMMPTLRLADTASVRLLSSVLDRGTVAERQAAIAMLGTARTAGANAALSTLVDRLVAGTLAPELALDVVEAAQASRAASLRTKLERFRTRRSAPTLVEALGPAMTAGGDARRGRQVVTQSAAGQCTRCHAIGQGTANVGPNLAGVGSRLTRPQLLESLLAPSARIAPGFTAPSAMPPMGQMLTPREIRDVVAYLAALR